ncbi:hypothetical protein MHYP_G00345290 [Metynnis hypsauchen]
MLVDEENPAHSNSGGAAATRPRQTLLEQTALIEQLSQWKFSRVSRSGALNRHRPPAPPPKEQARQQV